MQIPKSNLEWQKWGEVDPLWGVASWGGKQRGAEAPWTAEDFYELGRSDWKDFLEYWQKYGVDRTSCLEVGCGAGRITKHLSQFFQTTHAIDVSEGMISFARQHIEATSVIFHLVDGTGIPLPDRSVTAVFSTHVFQHFDSLAYATDYFRSISRCLRTGGSMMIHLPVYILPRHVPGFIRSVLKIRKSVSDVRAWLGRRLMSRGISKPIMRGLNYPIEYLYGTLPQLGFIDVEIGVFTVKSNGGLHTFLFARKGSGPPI